MSDERPTTDDDDPAPDDDVPADVVDRLEDESPGVLRAVAGYASALAGARVDGERPPKANEAGAPGDATERSSDHDEGLQRGEHETGHDGEGAEVEDRERPDGVPGKASITVKEINENRYYYWQWRDGDAVKSKYHGPVDSDS
jgi:hypothetical protein